MAKRSCARHVLGVFQSVFAAAVLYGILYLTVLFFQRAPFPKSPAELIKNPLPKISPGEPTELEAGTVLVGIPPTKLKLDKINPNANWFNRPESLVVPNDAYMGKRPHIDTVANISRMVIECRGSYEHIEKMPFVQQCMKYLEHGEQEYFYLPPNSERASQQSPQQAEYVNADGHGNTLSTYPAQKADTKDSVGQCNGPRIPFHVYWTGPATWRVEGFIKAHLYTQNIPCSQIWLWLDGDLDTNPVERMLTQDVLFKRFLPLVERGDIVLKTWKFPSRIPLPEGDNTDGQGYYKNPGKPNSKNETWVADGLLRDASGQEWLVMTEKQKTFLPVAVSDAVRFVVLHMHGGAYFDMDVFMLRDMRPLLIGDDHNFAERWGAHPSPGDYNTAIMSLRANSSLSSYLIRGGVRMGLNFHPLIMGKMAVKDKRNHEFHMLETAAVDAIWTDFDRLRSGSCTVPCLHDYGQAFVSNAEAFPLKDEWSAYEGEQLKLDAPPVKAHFWESRDIEERAVENPVQAALTYDRKALSKAPYKMEEDNFPPSNRTLENFFRGSFTYHIHNQWRKNPEPSSWLNVIQHAHNGFFEGRRTNPYGEKWNGPPIAPYEVSWEFT